MKKYKIVLSILVFCIFLWSQMTGGEAKEKSEVKSVMTQQANECQSKIWNQSYLLKINGRDVEDMQFLREDGNVYIAINPLLAVLKQGLVIEGNESTAMVYFEDKSIHLGERDYIPLEFLEDEFGASIVEGERTYFVTIDFQEDYYFYAKDIPEKILAIYEESGHIDPEIISYDDLKYLSLLYVDFQGETQVGELIVASQIAEEVCEIFKLLYEKQYPIEKMECIYKYNFSDDASMADNNTSGFNFRLVEGTDHLSKHALGLAIDINPMQNPYQVGDYISPPGSENYSNRDIYQKGMILEGDVLYEAFIERDYTWGGHWYTMKDYQHFQKNS